MQALMAQNSPPPFWPVVIRGTLGRCPNCGEGRLFAGYLKQVECCASCGEALGHIRADDGPAWLTILLMGHILAPFLFWVAPHTAWPNWAVVAVTMILALVLALAMLSRAKGFFIGMIWRAGCTGVQR
jgi:uncharacterized protein (DUF983 family)